MTHFELETVSDGAVRVRGQCSLAIGPGGVVHIAYTTIAGELIIASRDRATWKNDRVAVAPIIVAKEDERVWLQIDSVGNPHVAMVEESSHRLMYGERGSDGGWTFSAVPTQPPPHEPTAIDVCFVLHPGRQSPELRDTPHISFSDRSVDALGYARRIDGNWKVNRVALPREFGDAGSSRTGRFTSLNFNDLESLQVAYVETMEVSPTSIVHVNRILDLVDGTIGAERDLQKGQFITGRTSIFSQSPQTWVAYSIFSGDVSTRKLKAGTFTSDGIAEIEEVAGIKTNVVPVLAADPTVGNELSGRLRIVYADDGEIRLARRERLTGWTVDVVDADGGELPFLAYGGDGTAHIAYAAGGVLKYAKTIAK